MSLGQYAIILSILPRLTATDRANLREALDELDRRERAQAPESQLPIAWPSPLSEL